MLVDHEIVVRVSVCSNLKDSSTMTNNICRCSSSVLYKQVYPKVFNNIMVRVDSNKLKDTV